MNEKADTYRSEPQTNEDQFSGLKVPLGEVWASFSAEQRGEIARIIATLLMQVAVARHEALHVEAQRGNKVR